MLSTTSRYAVQALTYIASQGDGAPVLSREIAEQLELPTNYLSKILHQLGKDGLLQSTRGKTGGYSLARPASEIRVIDVVRRFDNPEDYRVCFLGGRPCSEARPCSAHDRWKPLADELLKFLEQTTLADLAT